MNLTQKRRLPFFVPDYLLKKISKIKKSGDKKNIKVYARNATIIPEMVNLVFDIHNGKGFVSVFITESMIGHKLGEFVLTRNFKSHCGTKADKAKIKGGKK